MTVAPEDRLGLHRFATALVGATVALIFVGGLVTSTGSGLAVPDWPLSFGQVFPPMVGGIFYEHGHRMVASLVGLLTIVLAVWIWVADPRRSVRRLALAAVGAVVAQGLLGGATVLLLLPPGISVAHACLAQVFLCITVALASATNPAWERLTPSPASAEAPSALATLAPLTALAVYLQLVLGAVMRHTGAGLAIPDFPLALGRLVPPFDSPGVGIHFAHRLGAVAVTVLIGCSAAVAGARHRDDRRLTTPALAAVALVIAQVSLGALTIWTRKAVLPTTLHVAVGAALLATTFLLALRARRLLAPPPALARSVTLAHRQVAT